MGTPSNVNWSEIMKHPSVSVATRMAVANTAPQHEDVTDEQLLKNFEARVPRLRRILEQSMAIVNGKQE